MFEADLWNVDSLSSANFIRFRHYVNIGVQRDNFPVPVLSRMATFALQQYSKVSSSTTRWVYTFVLVGGEKLLGKALLLVGFLSKLGLHNLHAQKVLLGKLDLHSPPFIMCYGRHTDRLTD